VKEPSDGGLPYIRALDGLRGVAVASVLLYHGSFGHFRGGFLGVDVFFVLSGFLITALLLEELRTNGRLAWSRFYGRRAGRLLPALAALLAGAALIWPYFKTSRSFSSILLPIVFYYANWTTAYSGWLGPLAHVWSLSVEEQFYIVWPLCLVLLYRRRSSPILIAVALAACAIARAIFHAAGSPIGDYVSTVSRADELLAGALAAHLASRVPPNVGRVCATITGVLLLLAFVAVDYHDAWLYYGGFTIAAVLLALLIVHLAADSTSAVKRLLERRELVGLGRISYGVYLYHLPIFLLLAPLGRPHSVVSRGLVLLLQLLVTVLMAWVSFRVVETPVRRWSRRLCDRRPQELTVAAEFL
jgi:peptidoglycan/LPS O-acetylase OafA/YrhL